MTAAELLNRDQQRSLRVTLTHAEQAVRTVEGLLAFPPIGLFSETTFELNPERRRDLEQRLAAMRRCLAEAKQRFDLPTDQRDGLRTARAALSVAWEGLEDAHATKLGRYGAVNPALAGELDPLIDHLIALVFEMLAVLDRQSPPAGR